MSLNTTLINLILKMTTDIIIKPKAVFKTIKDNLDALKEIDYKQLSKSEREEMKASLIELKELAESIKKQVISH
jgi:signal-transduction protein with cAMP-binding, CBS, and nucleotidyltransferase domain